MDSKVIDFIKRISEYAEVQSFLNVYNLVIKSGCCPKSTPQDWLKTLAYLHTKGWLYCAYENNKVSVVVGAYRIKEFKEELSDVMPENEEGTTLYIPFSVSVAEDKWLQLKLLRKYLKENKDIKEIVYYTGNQDLKYKKIILGGDDVEIKDTEFTSCSNK